MKEGVIEGKKVIVALHKEIYVLSKLEKDCYRTETIKKFIEKRQDNLTDNPKSMIASILEKKRRRITLDRILVTKDDAQILLTEPYEINQAIVDHYQMATQEINNVTFLNNRWQNQYALKEKIDIRWTENEKSNQKINRNMSSFK